MPCFDLIENENFAIISDFSPGESVGCCSVKTIDSYMKFKFYEW